jgi:glycosyltransferase involved in cell wall biosynthesis
VSVCVPTYNGEKYIAEAMNSIVIQDYGNLEVIISDDNSVDKTIEFATAILVKSKIPFKVFSHQPCGIAENWNHSIRQSNGTYIKFLFQDDVLHDHGCIRKMVSALESYKSAGMVFCSRKIIFESSVENDEWLLKFKNLHKHIEFNIKNAPVSGKKYLTSKKLLNKPLNKIGEPPTTLIRKACFDKLGYFDNSLVQALDLEYWYRIMTAYDLIFIDEDLVSFRLHNQQQSSKNQKRQINDFKLLPFIIFKRYFWHLHYKVKLKILWDMLAITKNKVFPK